MFILYIVYMLPKNCLVKLGYICIYIYMYKFSQNVTSLQLEFEYD